MNTAIYVVTIMGMLGIPSIFALSSWCVKQIINIKKTDKEERELIKRSIQTILKRELNRDYHKYMELGCITDDDFEEWCDTYEIYHLLFTNGKMTKKDNDIRQLPIVKNYP